MMYTNFVALNNTRSSKKLGEKAFFEEMKIKWYNISDKKNL